MKGLIVILIFLSLRGNQTKKFDYFEYHKQINKVEELIVNEDFDEAVKQLNGVLKEYEFRFVRDLVIASQINLLKSDKETSKYWIRESIKGGYKIECLKQIKIFQKELDEEDWQEIELEYKELRKEYLQKVDLELLKEFSERYKEEQDLKGTEQYKAIVYSNFSRIKDFLEGDHFPGEQIIGIDNSVFTSKLSDCLASNSKVIVTLLHYNNPISEIGEENLKKYIKKGELHPREFGIIYNFEINKISRLYKENPKEGKELGDYKLNFPFGEKDEDIERVNRDRMKFGICKYEIDKRKEEIERKYGLKLRFNYN